MVDKVVWKRLIYVGRRGVASAWRAEEEGGGVVLLLVPTDLLGDVIRAMRIEGHLFGANSVLHDEMYQMLQELGLAIYAIRDLGQFWLVDPSALERGTATASGRIADESET